MRFSLPQITGYVRFSHNDKLCVNCHAAMHHPIHCDHWPIYATDVYDKVQTCDFCAGVIDTLSSKGAEA